MKLQQKIWLVAVVVFSIITATDALVFRRMIKGAIRTELTRDARDVRAMMMATNHVYYQQFLDSGLPISDKTIGFLPMHTVSHISASFPGWSNSGLFFNNVSDHPRDPTNKADASELDAMAYFRAHPKAAERAVVITDNSGASLLHFTSPIWIEPSCLLCHGERSAAPASIARRYDRAYGYKVGELRGVMSIKLPMKPLLDQEILLWYRGFAIRLMGYVALLVLLGTLMNRLVSRRLARIETAAERIGAGDYAARGDIAGNDELASLGRSFERMAETLCQREQALREAEEKYHTFADFTYDWEVWIAPEGHYIYVSPACFRVTGYTAKEFMSDPSLMPRIVHPDDRAALAPHFASVHAPSHSPCSTQFRVISKSGEIHWIEHICQAVIRKDGTYLGRRASNRDVSEHKRAEQQLHLAASVFTHAREGIMITAADGTIIDVNEAFTNITGFSREEILSKNPRFLKSGRQSQAFYSDMWRSLTEKGHWNGEIWNRKKNGEVYAEMLTISSLLEERGTATQYVALFSDITKIKEHQDELEHIAHYDALTLLPNRVLLADRLLQAMAQAQRRGQQLAVAYLDLDGFKAINDRHGHDVGDLVLTAVAARMKKVLREGDTLARLGGDEFVAVLLDLSDIEASVPMLTRLLSAVAESVKFGDLTLLVSASVGVTFYPQAEDVDADQLLRQADQAMYQAKLTGKDRYHVFDPEQDRSIRGHHESLEHIRLALTAREFVLYYQPKVNMRKGTVVGAEALIRWQHPQRGLLPPALFLPVIEDHPLAVELGDWVIDTALNQMEIWLDAGLDMPVSVNVGALQLQQTDFVDRLRAMLEAHPRIKPSSLELEVLETSALQDLAKVSKVINACREIGVMFALDDFGTGYSSLAYLKRLPAHVLKIDQSFVRDMLDDPENLAILEGVLGLATAFRRQAIAEGVETVEHGLMLLQLGCELAQGYGIARPMPARDIPGWTASWCPDPSWADVTSVGPDDLALIIAGVEHRAWIVAIEAALRSERHPPPPLDHHQCRFGSWLDAEALAGRSTHPTFQAIAQLHRQVHALAAELRELQIQGQNAAGLARLGELHSLRDRLLEQLKMLMAKGLT